jgi:bifunctional DNA-binding transcriptional regulator/antitoxin component of YhaV-PrlF toxin-antitoxin module
MARPEDGAMSTRARPPHLGRRDEQVTSALLPDSTAPRPAPRAISLSRLPAPHQPSSDGPDALHVGVACADRSGRIHERALLRALGWEPGHALEIDTSGGMIAITSAAGGRHRVDDRGALALPAAARRRCGVTIGPPVVLVAALRQQLLVVHPAATVARILAAHHAKLIGIRDAR